jgi:hypothetical protein
MTAHETRTLGAANVPADFAAPAGAADVLDAPAIAFTGARIMVANKAATKDWPASLETRTGY